MKPSFDKSRLSPNDITLGIIGGGQLGKMIGIEAKRMSLNLAYLDPDKTCPASTIADQMIVSDFKDEKSILELAKKSDVLTYEIELANSSVLKDLESKGHTVHPSSGVLNTIQNKLRQKIFLRAKGIPVPEFEEVTSVEQVRKICKEFDYPLVLKACEDSYDGRGNFLIRSPRDVERGIKYFEARKCMIEKFIHFSKEVSVMVARNTRGQIVSFPLVQNIHTNGVLDTTIVPAGVNGNVESNAKSIAEKVVKSLKGVGIFGIEMFLDDNKLMINEIAPRPHNSGHYSIEACSVSQFELHIRAILGLPLVKPRLISPVVMMNILGIPNYTGEYSFKGIDKALAIPGLKLHFYGKMITKPLRKLGHFTITAENIEEALSSARRVRNLLRVGKPRGNKKEN
ncbi:MAG TPA: 5-(carboxyamino)imidazole ribonucleotide synthase [Nitrososphaeraceae archaeon]|nr:5-(carboxyamino)imidazole ribonucleotide synthase [Nitrososphaeraceae archaeon]